MDVATSDTRQKTTTLHVDDPSAEHMRNLRPVEFVERLGQPALGDLETTLTVPMELRHNVMVTSFDKLVNWARKSSLWPVAFGLACCAIEMIAVGSARFDIARFGAEKFSGSPRQADLMIVAGTVTTKMAPVVRRIYDQMADPKYVIAMGTCTIAGGPFQGSYSTVPGIDNFLPVDVHVPGCPPRPDALLWGIMKLQEKIENQSVAEQRRAAMG
jgi:NADH-quinone oxidoreductase subunit B